MNICVYGSSSDAIDKTFIQEGERLGEEIVKRGHTLVFGAGAAGLMGAAARGAFRQGGKIIGVAPKFFNVDGVLFENCDELIRPDTMRERKQILEDSSDAFIMTPGGIGTYEEFFEVLTLKQLDRHNKPIVILNTNSYYDAMHKLMETTAEGGFMRDFTLKLYEMFDTVEEVLDYIENYKPFEYDLEDVKHVGRQK